MLEVLCSNHPGARPLTAGSFEAYGSKPPASVLVDIIDKTVNYVAQRLLGATGKGGNYLVSL